MKDKKMRLANAFALAMAVLWTLCSLSVALLPVLSYQVMIWWMHGMDLSALGSWELTLENFFLGGVTAVVSAWVAGWVLGWSWKVVGRK